MMGRQKNLMFTFAAVWLFLGVADGFNYGTPDMIYPHGFLEQQARRFPIGGAYHIKEQRRNPRGHWSATTNPVWSSNFGWTGDQRSSTRPDAIALHPYEDWLQPQQYDFGKNGRTRVNRNKGLGFADGISSVDTFDDKERTERSGKLEHGSDDDDSMFYSHKREERMASLALDEADVDGESRDERSLRGSSPCGDPSRNCIVDGDITCTKRRILVTLRFATSFRGKIHVWGRPRDCVLFEAPKGSSGPIDVHFKLGKLTCPTYTGYVPPPYKEDAWDEESEDPSNFKGRRQFRLSVQFDPELHSSEDVNFVVRCRDPKAKKLNVGSYLGIIDKKEDPVADLEVFLRRGSRRFDPLVTKAVRFGENLLLHVALKQDVAEKTKIVPTECIALEGSTNDVLEDGERPRSAKLIVNGCTLRPKLIGTFRSIVERDPTDPYRVILSGVVRFKAFQFRGVDTASIKCKLHICSGHCPKPSCGHITGKSDPNDIDEGSAELVDSREGPVRTGLYVDSYVIEKTFRLQEKQLKSDKYEESEADGRFRRSPKITQITLGAEQDAMTLKTSCELGSAEVSLLEIEGFAGTVTLEPLLEPNLANLTSGGLIPTNEKCRTLISLDGTQQTAFLRLPINICDPQEILMYVITFKTSHETKRVTFDCTEDEMVAFGMDDEVQTASTTSSSEAFAEENIITLEENLAFA